MKQLIAGTLSAMLLITLIAACGSDSSGSTKKLQRAKIEVIDFPLDSLRKYTGFDPIPYDEADMIYDNYRDKIKPKLERGWLGDDNIPKKDSQSRYIWLEYAKLKQFVDALGLLQKQMDSGQYAGARVSGVRIYLGTYPRNYNNERTKRRLTIIACGTYQFGGNHIDIVNRPGKQMLALNADEFQNHGHLCPPDICPGALLDEQ